MGGYFTDDSMMRRVYRERAMALAGPRALLMQAAHPLAVSGLLAHTSALDEPYERLDAHGRGDEHDHVRHARGRGSRHARRAGDAPDA